MRWLLSITWAAIAMLLPGLGACSACGDVDCGTGVVVYWLPADIPEAPGHRLCVDGRCEQVTPQPLGGEVQYLGVSPTTARSESDVHVRLELLDDAGRPTKAYTGGGRKRGDCCPGIELRATEEGDLVVDPM